jgi:hypothetical protein
VTLTAGKHFAWVLRFYIDSPNGLGPCAGCDAKATIMLDNWTPSTINGVCSVTSNDVGSSPTACANGDRPSRTTSLRFQPDSFPLASRSRPAWAALLGAE